MSLTPQSDAWRATQDAWWAGLAKQRQKAEAKAALDPTVQREKYVERLRALKENGVKLSPYELGVLESRTNYEPPSPPPPATGPTPSKIYKDFERQWQKLSTTERGKARGQKSYHKELIAILPEVDWNAVTQTMDAATLASIQTLDTLAAETALATSEPWPVRSGFSKSRLVVEWFEEGRAIGVQFLSLAPYTFVASATNKAWWVARRAQKAGLQRAGQLAAKAFGAVGRTAA